MAAWFLLALRSVAWIVKRYTRQLLRPVRVSMDLEKTQLSVEWVCVVHQWLSQRWYICRAYGYLKMVIFCIVWTGDQSLPHYQKVFPKINIGMCTCVPTLGLELVISVDVPQIGLLPKQNYKANCMLATWLIATLLKVASCLRPV